MFALNLPRADVKISERDGKPVVFDFLRRRYVALTPEEWVRQQFTRHLTDHLGYPAALMGNEMELEADGKKRRCDSVVFGRDGRPLVVIEYKAPTIAITQRVFEQISSYVVVLHTRYIMASNGMAHYCARVDYERRAYVILPSLPRYEEL